MVGAESLTMAHKQTMANKHAERCKTFKLIGRKDWKESAAGYTAATSQESEDNKRNRRHAKYRGRMENRDANVHRTMQNRCRVARIIQKMQITQ